MTRNTPPHRVLLPGLVLLALLGGIVTGCGEPQPMDIAVILPLSGEFAVYGEPIRKGIELAYEEIEATNAERAIPLAIEVTDSQGEPERARSLLEQAYDDGSPAAIGGATTAEALAMVELADNEDRVLLSPSASSPRLTGISSNFFRVFPSDFLEGTKMGTFVTQTLNLDEVVIVASESPYAKGVQEVFASEVRRNGGEVVEIIEYPPGTSELEGVIERVMTLDPPAVYLADYADGLVALIEGLRAAGYRGRILTTSSFATSAIADAGEVIEGVIFTQASFSVTSEDPQIQEFVRAYREKYDMEPDIFAAHGYDAMRVMAEAVARGDGRLPSNVWQGFRGIREFDGVTGNIQFDEKGDVQKYPSVYTVQDGQFVDYEQVLDARRRDLEQRRRDIEDRLRRLNQASDALNEGS